MISNVGGLSSWQRIVVWGFEISSILIAEAMNNYKDVSVFSR